jgi:hypothetical protein
VIEIEEWPRSFDTTAMSVPDASRSDTAPWRRSWRRTLRTPADSHSSVNRLVTKSGRSLTAASCAMYACWSSSVVSSARNWSAEAGDRHSRGHQYSADVGALVDPNTGVPVRFTITMGANAQPGGTGQISAASSGLETVPQSQYQGQTHYALRSGRQRPGHVPGSGSSILAESP